jgi:hypothetical protein
VLGVGTGFFFDADGAVLTAYHVVDASGSAADCPVSYVGIDPDRASTPSSSSASTPTWTWR